MPPPDILENGAEGPFEILETNSQTAGVITKKKQSQHFADTFLLLQAEYLDLKEWFSTVSAAMSPSNTYIQAVINTENPVVSISVIFIL